MKERELLKQARDWIDGNGRYDKAKQLVKDIDEALANHIPDAENMVAQPEQEPVAWVCRHKLDLVNGKTSLLCTTDKELADAWLSDYKEGYAWLIPVFDPVTPIEAAHGIKENT